MTQIRYDPDKNLFHCIECGGIDYCSCVFEDDPICECGELAWECDCYEREQEFRKLNGCECLHGPCLCEARLSEETFSEVFREWLLSKTPSATITESSNTTTKEGPNDWSHPTNHGV